MNNFIIVRALRKLGKLAGYRLDFTPMEISDDRKAKEEYFFRMTKRAAIFDGDFVECGLGNGFSFALLAKAAESAGKKIYGFDSFEGFPAPSESDLSRYKIKEGDWSDVECKNVEDAVKKFVTEEYFQNSVKITPGFFSDSLPTVSLSSISLLHLDVDLYQSYIDCFEALFDKVVVGGIIIIDEYLNGIEYAKYPGGYLAQRDFLADKNVDICRDFCTGKYFLVKR